MATCCTSTSTSHPRASRWTPGYGDSGIRYVNVLDFIAGAQAARVQRSPKSVPAPSVSVAYDGWVFPRSGVAFVWVLDEEVAEPTTGT